MPMPSSCERAPRRAFPLGTGATSHGTPETISAAFWFCFTLATYHEPLVTMATLPYGHPPLAKLPGDAARLGRSNTELRAPGSAELERSDRCWISQGAGAEVALHHAAAEGDQQRVDPLVVAATLVTGTPDGAAVVWPGLDELLRRGDEVVPRPRIRWIGHAGFVKERFVVEERRALDGPGHTILPGLPAIRLPPDIVFRVRITFEQRREIDDDATRAKVSHLSLVGIGDVGR